MNDRGPRPRKLSDATRRLDVAERRGDLARPRDEQLDRLVAHVLEQQLSEAADRDGCPDPARVVEDRSAERRDAVRDVLVADRIALRERALEPVEQRLARDGRLLRHRLERAPLDVGLPLFARLPREQRAGAGAEMKRQRAAEAER